MKASDFNHWGDDFVRIIGMMRIRNEELIIEDSLDHLGRIVDGIVLFDDASTDRTVEIAWRHPKVLEIVRNPQWRLHRTREETRNRQALLDAALKYNPEWLFYADCDERYEGDIRGFLLSPESSSIDAVRISLFDAYMTSQDCHAYKSGPLLNFRARFGPERRDILMMWKNNLDCRFIGLDSREPVVSGVIVTKFFCQHYGKALSIEHWESTCDYYSTYFPEIYAEKWRQRRGKAIHDTSDFGTPLGSWEQVKGNPTVIYP